MGDRRFITKSSGDAHETYRQSQSDRVAAEIRDVQDRPIAGLHYDTITTQMENGEQLSVMMFEVKKYGLVLQILLPKTYPSVPPVVSFVYKGIPSHPDVDQETGDVRGSWSEVENWRPVSKIRDICAEVMNMLAGAGTPPAPVTNLNREESDETKLRFPVTPTEFRYLCKFAAEYVNELRSRYRCLIKYTFKPKNGKNEGPHMAISSATKLTTETVAAALEEYLIYEGQRRVAVFKRIDPEPDANAFVSSFAPPSAEEFIGGDLINFDAISYNGRQGNTDHYCACDWNSPLSNEEANGSVVASSPTAVSLVSSNRSGLADENFNLLDMQSVGSGGDQMSAPKIATSRGTGTAKGIGAGEEERNTKEYSEEELYGLVDNVRRTLDKMICGELHQFTKFTESLDVASSKADVLKARINLFSVMNQHHRALIGSQRCMINNQDVDMRRMKDDAYRFRCCVCMQRWVDARLNCGHVFCRNCAGNQDRYCPICRKEIKSILNLYTST